MKKHITLILAITLCALFTACGSLLDATTGGDPYTATNLRWEDPGAGLIAFDVPRAELDNEAYCYVVEMYKDGVEMGGIGINGSFPDLTVRTELAYAMQEPGEYQFRVYVDSGERTIIGDVAVSETIYHEGAVIIDPDTGLQTDGYGRIVRPDEPVAPNETGNTASNIVNGGWVTEKDGWVYYTAPTATGITVDAGLYKMRPDGAERGTVLDTDLASQKAQYVNVVGNWIYYSDGGLDIFKLHVDGHTGAELVPGGYMIGGAQYMSVVGDWIYYVQSGYADAPGLYRRKTDGSEEHYMAEGDIDYINVVDGWIYFGTSSRELWKIRTDGSDETLIEVAQPEDNEYFRWTMRYAIVHEGKIYGLDSSHAIYVTGLDGKDTEKIIEGAIQDMAIGGGRLYYVLSDSGQKILYQANLDGSGAVEVTRLEEYAGENFNDLQIAGDWIYWHHAGYCHRIKNDGTGRKQLGRID